MKILHAPENICGQASVISRAQRALGVKSDVLVFNQNVRNYECDTNLNLNKKPRVIRLILQAINFIRCLFKYEVFHFHFGASLLPYNMDLPILKLFKKKIVMHYWGSDVIQSDFDLAINNYLFTMEDLKEIYPNTNKDKRRKRISRINKYVNVSIVGDYSLLPFSPDSIVIRQAVDLTELPFVGCEAKRGTIKIVHAPTDRMKKGTNDILSIIERLKNEGYAIDFIIVENKLHKEALEIYKDAEIIIDEILMGPYGILAIECMALGKPVLCRIGDKFIKYYPNLPILNTNPDNLYDNLKLLIENPELRRELGIRGREYVVKNHDSKMIAKQLLELYKGL